MMTLADVWIERIQEKRLEKSDLRFFMIVQPEFTGLSKILL
ncbi:hypothetical protein DFR64_2883 [Pelolinea submarina]|uniref:Uncharacterized protein n=1 Tax=Pelolinea submarina TaxID=913107 RepID=A0A3E0A4J4_9CHLR|nr:hypothetical protein DFR64_2883 [Pelolinea submarina]